MKQLFLSLVLVSVSVVSLHHPACAADVQATPGEVIAEVEKATGCTKDALDAVMKESPQLFEKVSDTVTGIKVIDLILEAKDTEAVAEVAKWQIGKGVDVILKKVFPAPMLSALSAFKAYYAALELMRDYLVIPAFDERLYRAYKGQRSGAGGGSPEAAFTEATVMPASGYYLVKPSMLDKYIKSRGWNKEAMGESMVKNAERQIDDFWQKRLEARYQKDLTAEQAAKIKIQMWNAQGAALAAIRTAAAKYVNAYPYFLTRSDVDALQGYKFSLYTYWPPKSPDRFPPTMEKDADVVIQSFTVIPKNVTEKKRADDGFPVCYDARGERMHNGPYVSISIQMVPRIMSGVYQGKPYTIDILEDEKNLSIYDTHPFLAVSRELKESGMEFGYLLRKASKDGTGGEEGHIVTFFTDKNRFMVGVSNYYPSHPHDTASLAIQIARVILGKLKK